MYSSVSMVAISIARLLSKLGFKTCCNGYYKSYAKRLIPVRNGKGVSGPPLFGWAHFDFINCHFESVSDKIAENPTMLKKKKKN